MSDQDIIDGMLDPEGFTRYGGNCVCGAVYA